MSTARTQRIKNFDSSKMEMEMDSQLPQEDGFSMSRPLDEILPTPPLPKRTITADTHEDSGAELLDISDSPPKGDVLSEAVSQAISGTEDLPDACWNIMDDVSVDPDQNPNSVSNPSPPPAPALPAKNATRCVTFTLDSQGEFRKEPTPSDGASADEVGGDSGVSATEFPPPNQLALSMDKPSNPSWLPSSDRPQKRRMQESILSLHGATMVADPPGPLAARLTSAIGRVNYFCPVLEVSRNGESGFLQHDFPLLDIEEIPDPTPKEMGEERFCAVKELASNKTLRTVPRDDVLDFVLVVFSNGSMFIPSISFFDMIIGRIEENIITKFPNLRPLHWTSSRWMGCGILELTLSPLLEEWRLTLSRMDLPSDFKVDTFPKASLLMGPDVTAMLKDIYWEYSKRLISHSLMYRNKALRGNVRVAFSKEYGEHDLTRFGVSMHRWQMVYLAGDCIFMEFLSKHPVSHRFIIGPSTVVLKGGIRKPSFLVDKPNTSFTWTRTTYTPALLEPAYKLPASSDPPAFKSLTAATAKLCIAAGSSSSLPPSSSSASESPSTRISSSAPVRSTPSSSSTSSSASASLACPKDPGPSSSSLAVVQRRGPPLRKASSAPGPNAKPKSRAARLKLKNKKSCC